MSQGHFRKMAISAAAIGMLAPLHAQMSDNVIKIGFITDMSGSYADLDGPAGAEAINMAIADMGGAIDGKKVVLLTSNHQNKADMAASKARAWFDTEGLDLLIGGSNSAASLAMAQVATEKKKPFISIGAATARLTNEDCSPYTVHYAFDTVSLANGTGSAIVKDGGKSWFFMTADYAFGHSLEQDTAAVVKAAGGSVVGSTRHPQGASDFSAFVLRAQNSKAQILGLANGGGDTVNAIKSANEFGVNKTMKLAGMLMFINDIHALGLPLTQGMYITDSWYWDLTPASREWSKRFYGKFKRMPSSLQAANYSAASHYLKAVAAAKSDAADAVMQKMKALPVEDMYTKGSIREDGRGIHDMYLLQVKKPAESKQSWDYFKVVATIPGDEAFTKPADSKCAFFKQSQPKP
ncbi:ABC transporter substrate-binding protein [Comamonas sp. A7-5]|uniref:ABC transporter substrate-binding protein n=1 Tax=Comamonas sp. A7-5 TaxID=673549 RepID=UPI0031CDBC42